MLSDFKRVLLESCSGIEILGISLKNFNFNFESKPLLIGGKAMEYYGVREAGDDIDFVISEDDYELLAIRDPDSVKEIWEDFGICKYEFELWKSICLFKYDFLCEDAVEEEDFFIISFEKLMFLKVLTISNKKSLNDLVLMRDRIAVINTMIQDYY